MKSVRSRTSSRSISRRPRGSKRHSSTRSACLEKRAKLTPAPSHVAPSGYARPRQTVLCATTDRAGASTGGERLRRNRFRRRREVAAVRAPAAVLLALHRVIGEPLRTAAINDLHPLHGVLTQRRQAQEYHGLRPHHRTVRSPHHIQEPFRRAE